MTQENLNLEEGVEIEIGEEIENPNPNPTSNENVERVEQRLAEANRKLEKAKELESKYQNQGSSPMPAPPSAEEMRKVLEAEAKEIGYYKENDDGDMVPDVEMLEKVAKVAGKVGLAQQSSYTKQISKLEARIAELEIGANDPDYARVKTTINDFIDNDETLSSLKGKISDTELKKLAMKVQKSAQQTKKGRVMTPYKPDVTTTVSGKKTIRLTEEDIMICKQGNLDQKAYAKVKYGG